MTTIPQSQPAFKTREERDAARAAASAAEAYRDLLPLSWEDRRASLNRFLLHSSASHNHPSTHWHGIHLVIDEESEGTELLDAGLDDVEEFVELHGEPATHARAKAYAEAEFNLGTSTIVHAVGDAYADWCEWQRRDRDPEGA